jgi:hypothetical protein
MAAKPCPVILAIGMASSSARVEHFWRHLTTREMLEFGATNRAGMSQV